MGYVRQIVCVAIAVALLSGASAANAAPREPLVVTHLPDPDPDYVLPPPEPKRPAGRRDNANQDTSIDTAMQTFGRAIGQAGLVIRQKAEAKCRERIPADVPVEQRYAWEASCSYRRY